MADDLQPVMDALEGVGQRLDALQSRRSDRRRADADGVRIVHNKLLGSWYVVRGPHQTPISGKFGSKEEAQTWLTNRGKGGGERKDSADERSDAQTLTRDQRAELANLLTTARTALANDPKKRSERYYWKLWAAAEFHKLHPEISEKAAYMAFERNDAADDDEPMTQGETKAAFR
jgi:hypothetical protein